MKLGRLWQPGRALFWLMVAFNVLSSVGSYVMRNGSLSDAGMLLVGCVSLINVAGGLWAAWQLIKDPPPAEAESKTGVA